MKKIVQLTLAFVCFSSFGQALTCKDFKEGKFVSEIGKNAQSEPLKTDFFEPLKKSFKVML